MEGKIRRIKILDYLKNVKKTVTGTQLANRFKVSRQIIVQDIALIRAEGIRILSTYNGYILEKHKESVVRKALAIKHTADEIEDELQTIVDMGGTVLDVVVSHRVYGDISVPLLITSRKDIDQFIKKVNAGNFVPLMNLTDGVHFHTIETKDEESMLDIENALEEKGYLLSD